MDLRRAPMTDDNSPYISPNMFPLGSITHFCGIADNVTTGVEKGGDLFTVESAIVEDKEFDFQFVRWSYIAGGHIFYKGSVLGDAVSFETRVPATVGISNPGAGWYHKYEIVPSSGMHIYAPSATQTGDWDLDLTETLNANVGFTKAAPVPSPGYNGYFDYDVDDPDKVTLNTDGKGGYNLFDFAMQLDEFVSKVPLLGDDHFPLTVPAVKPVKLLPQWTFRVTLHNSSEKDLEFAFVLYRAKGNTV